MQFCPPYFGSGLVQDRSLCTFPVLQGLLQNVHGVHSVKPPSTVIENNLIEKNYQREDRIQPEDRI